MQANALAAIASAGSIFAIGILIVAFVDLEPLSFHMLLHIGMMNLAAPLMAAGLMMYDRSKSSPRLFWLAALLQIALLWAWHAPGAQRLIVHSYLAQILLHASLLVAAVMFWTALLHLQNHARWHGIAGLLLTGKLACLLAALLIFAPSVLYVAMHHATEISLPDQQLAGLLMITACPLSYIVAAIVLTVQILNGQETVSLRNAGAR